MKPIVTACGKEAATIIARRMALEAIQRNAQDLIQNAAAWGFIVTVEQVPLQPLAMGHYTTRISVRAARGDVVYLEDAA